MSTGKMFGPSCGAQQALRQRSERQPSDRQAGMRGLRERARWRVRRLTIDVSEHDLQSLARIRRVRKDRPRSNTTQTLFSYSMPGGALAGVGWGIEGIRNGIQL